MFTFAGGDVSWLSKLQIVVVLSTKEVEYMVATKTCKEIIWIQMLIEKLEHKQQMCIVTVKMSCILQGIQFFIVTLKIVNRCHNKAN